MREQAKKKVKIKNKILGGERQLICQPIAAQNLQELLDQAQAVVKCKPDLIEWRADSFLDLNAIMNAGYELRQKTKEIPLIFTLRHYQEGGMRHISQDLRMDVIKGVMQAGLVDLIDIELFNGEDFINEIRRLAKEYDVKLILSYHDFEHTPAEEMIIAKLKQAEELGADIAKLAATPNDYRDVLTFLSATYTARKDVLDIPIIAMSMGSKGVISRIAGGLFGSDMTFAAGKVSSAPGQISIEDIRSIARIIGNQTMKPNIVLIGFMGVGKTPIGLKLSEKLQKNFIDSDQEIESSMNMTISEIFAKYGEEYFRQKESEVINKIALQDDLVISTGGGVVLDEKNIDALRQKGTIICLTAQPEVIYERVKQNNQKPLLAGEDRYERIIRILNERKEKYLCADHYVDTSTISIEEAAEEIISLLKCRGKVREA